MLDTSFLDDAFPDKAASDFADLKESVRSIITSLPGTHQTFSRISSYITSLRAAIPEGTTIEDGHATKKRKLDPKTVVGKDDSEDGASELLLRVPDISFSLPQRKKFTLQITTTSLQIESATTQESELLFKDISYITCLPVPDKAAKQWNFCVFTKNSEGFGERMGEVWVWTINDGVLKNVTGKAMDGVQQDNCDFRALITSTINDQLRGGLKVIEPNPDIFRSTLVQSHRKTEISFHVKAHRGTKEGYLFFLENAIIWAFKKPLCCFFFDAIESVSYSNITQRTFNLHIQTSASNGSEEIEFVMIDQADFPPIDAFLKSNQLNDASMAEGRRAKKINVNGRGKGEDNGAQENGGEIQKALNEIEFEDDEDEEDDEDYEAGSDSDDGSGSEEGSEEGEEGGDDDDEGGEEEEEDDDDDQRNHSEMEHESG